MNEFTALLAAYRNTSPSDQVALARLVADNPKIHFAQLAEAESDEGEWKTVQGRHLFIKKGQSVQDALGEKNPTKDDSIYTKSHTDISDDTKDFPDGWKLEQDGGLFVMKNKEGKVIAASGSRTGTIQQSKSHPSHPDFKPSDKSPKSSKPKNRTQADRAMDKLKDSVSKLK